MIPDPWPLFGLRLETDRLEMRPPTDDDLVALAETAAAGVHDPATMPFSTPWTDTEPEALPRHFLQHHWKVRAELTPQRWCVPLGVWCNGEAVGVQDVVAHGFAARRTVETGSWLGRRHQGRGIGTEMRAAVLRLAFERLGARRAETQAFADNGASQRVTAKLGYRPNGDAIFLRRGTEPTRALRYAMDADDWAAQPHDPVTVSGLEPCLPLLGLL